MYCFQETSRFAKSCRKRGGFFKCCVSTWSLTVFEKVRNLLVSSNIKNKKNQQVFYSFTSSYCDCSESGKNNDYCKKWRKRRTDPCNVCTVDAVCSQRDSATNVITHTLKAPFRKEHQVVDYSFNPIPCYQVGGSHQSLQSQSWSPGGLRLKWCEVPDLCQVSRWFSLVHLASSEGISLWRIFVFVFVFANTSPNICIRIHIRPFLSTQIYLYSYLLCFF